MLCFEKEDGEADLFYQKDFLTLFENKRKQKGWKPPLFVFTDACHSEESIRNLFQSANVF